MSAFAAVGTDLFVSTREAGGVFRSTDSGESWTPAGLEDKSIASLVARGGTLFAGTTVSDTSFDKGVYRSTDNGATWALVGLGNTEVTALAADDSRVYAGTWGQGVLYSSNDGASWSAASTVFENLYIRSLALTESGLFAGTSGSANSNGYIYRSVDDGVNWTKVYTTPFVGFNGVPVYALAGSGSNVFAGLGDELGILRSTNGGSTWATFNSAELDEHWIYALAANENFLFAATDRGVYRSLPTAANWVEGPWLEGSSNALAVAGSYLFVGTDQGIYRSNDDGASWMDCNHGFACTFPDGLVASESALFCSVEGDHFFRTTDEGATWAEVSGLSNLYVRAFGESGTTMFVGTSSGIYRSNDGGANWTRNAGQPADTNIRSFAVDGTSLFAGTAGEIFRSTDNGATWTATATQPTGDIAELVSSSAVLFASTGDGVFRSTDNGATWTKPSDGPSSGSRLVVQGTELFAKGSDKIYRLGEGADSWTVMNGPAASIYGFAGSETSLFVSTWSSGVYQSDDGGESWTELNTGLGSVVVTDLEVSGTNLFAATFFAGVWRLPL